MCFSYGDGGIVLSSSDRGNSWQQIIAAPDSFSIKVIKNNEHEYYGILNKDFFINSNDDGLNWNLFKIDDGIQLISMVVNLLELFILTQSMVLIYDYNFKLKNAILIDSNIHPSDIKYFDDLLFISADSGKIIVYDMSNNFQARSIDFKADSMCVNCPRVNQMKIKNGKIYITLGVELFQSSDKGYKWKKIASNIPNSEKTINFIL